MGTYSLAFYMYKGPFGHENIPIFAIMISGTSHTFVKKALSAIPAMLLATVLISGCTTTTDDATIPAPQTPEPVEVPDVDESVETTSEVTESSLVFDADGSITLAYLEDDNQNAQLLAFNRTGDFAEGLVEPYESFIVSYCNSGILPEDTAVTIAADDRDNINECLKMLVEIMEVNNLNPETTAIYLELENHYNPAGSLKSEAIADTSAEAEDIIREASSCDLTPIQVLASTPADTEYPAQYIDGKELASCYSK